MQSFQFINFVSIQLQAFNLSFRTKLKSCAERKI